MKIEDIRKQFKAKDMLDVGDSMTEEEMAKNKKLEVELSKCREELENANGLCHELGATCCKQEIEILRLKDYNKKALELANRVEGECDEYINKLNKCREERIKDGALINEMTYELNQARERIKNISSLLKFFADRLIYHYDEDTNMDYIIKAYSLIKELEESGRGSGVVEEEIRK